MRRTLALLLPLIFTGLLLIGGCGHKQPTVKSTAMELPDAISSSIDKTISDPARAQVAKNQAIKLDYIIQDFSDEMWKIQTRAFYLNANYATSVEDYQKFMEERKDLRALKQGEVIQAALDARGTMTELEWASFHEELDKKLNND